MRWLPAALPVAMLAWLLLLPVPSGHGADEVAFTALDHVDVATGRTLTQPLAAQAAGLSAIELPYRVGGPGTADVRVSFVTRSGDEVAGRTVRLAAGAWPLDLLQSQLQYGDGVQVVSVNVPQNRAGDVPALRVRRTGGEGRLTLFLSSGRTARLPALDGDPGHSLALRTVYGGYAPALTRAGTFLARMGTWSPPWLPPPVLALLALLAVAGGVALVVLPGGHE